MASLQTPVIEFPEDLQILFRPKRYKIMWGGRGGTRSWSAARALLVEGTQRAQRVLCGRELQKSISESVHRLLADQIVTLGMQDNYVVEQQKIHARNGGYFVFEGVKNNIAKIKSYEGLDRVWLEEANAVSKKSWEDLIPTVRKPDSEIWATFNPELVTDYTYKHFVLVPPDTVLRRWQTKSGNPCFETADAFVVKMTWADNPWFPPVLLKEMEKMRRDDPDAFDNVWGGNCRQALEGAVFAKELRWASEHGRICRVPWDRETPVDTFWDLGRRDMTSIWFAQRVAMQRRMLEYFEDSNEDIHYYLRHLQTLGYTYGTFYLPHDAKNKVLGAQRSIEQIVRNAGFRVQLVQRVNKKVNAINAARIVFPNCWFDETRCAEGIERLRHYRYAIVDGRRTEEPLHDDNSNGADAFMTMAQSLQTGRGADEANELLRRLAGPERRGDDEVRQHHNWMQR
jgi:phage terminase large subunit